MPLLLLILMTRVRRDDMDFLGSHYLIRTLLRAAETTLHDFSSHYPHPTLENRGGILSAKEAYYKPRTPNSLLRLNHYWKHLLLTRYRETRSKNG